MSSVWCVEFSASTFGSDITHNIAAGSALKSATAGALRNLQFASHFQTIKCQADFHYSTVGSGQHFHSLSPMCCGRFHSLDFQWRNNASVLNCWAGVALFFCFHASASVQSIQECQWRLVWGCCIMVLWDHRKHTHKVCSMKPSLSHGGRSWPGGTTRRPVC